MSSNYQTYDNRNFSLAGTYDTALISSNYTANVEMCKKYCDSFDECNGFSHDQMTGNCVFYGPQRSIDLDKHYGHMASYLKTCSKLSKVDQIAQSKTIIESLLKSFDKSNTEKLNENRKILESVDSKKYHKFNDDVVNSSVNYERTNGVLNVEYKDASPVKNYSSISAIDSDANKLINTINTSWIDYAKVQEAHDLLTTIYDDLPVEDAKTYAIEIDNNMKSSKLVIQQASMLLDILKEYKKVLMVKQLMIKMKNELNKYENDLAVSVDSIINTSIPQVIAAKKSRAEESFKHIIDQLELFRNLQGIALTINHEKVPARDITIIYNINKTVVNIFTTSIENSTKINIHSGIKYNYTIASNDERLEKSAIRKNDTFVDFSKNGNTTINEEILPAKTVPTETKEDGFIIMTNLQPTVPKTTDYQIPKLEPTIISPKYDSPIQQGGNKILKNLNYTKNNCKEQNDVCDLLIPASLFVIFVGFIMYKNMQKTDDIA